ncbi:MAG: hypothetical protein LUG83_01230 [Lachnospiraceae bacterium]|nr:hypothetical protein [Lachnospiraceae bacterium]
MERTKIMNIIHAEYNKYQNTIDINYYNGYILQGLTSVVWKGGLPMDILGLIAVLGFGLTCFGIGCSIGKDSNHTRNNRPSRQTVSGYFV